MSITKKQEVERGRKGYEKQEEAYHGEEKGAKRQKTRTLKKGHSMSRGARKSGREQCP